MSLTLSTVKDYVTDVRTLILDRVQPYRYGDDSIIRALNLALLEVRRMRADLFVGGRGDTDVPSYDAVSGAYVPIEPQFRLAMTYGIAAQVLARDDDDIQDTRVNSFMNFFQAVLMGQPATPPIQGGGSPPGSAQR